MSPDRQITFSRGRPNHKRPCSRRTNNWASCAAAPAASATAPPASRNSSIRLSSWKGCCSGYPAPSKLIYRTWVGAKVTKRRTPPPPPPTGGSTTTTLAHRPGPGHDPGQAVRGQTRPPCAAASAGRLAGGSLRCLQSFGKNSREQQKSRYELTSQKRFPIAEPNQMTRASRFCRAR